MYSGKLKQENRSSAGNTKIGFIELFWMTSAKNFLNNNYNYTCLVHEDLVEVTQNYSGIIDHY